MRTLYFIISFALTSVSFFAQKDGSFKVQIGNYKCSPDFRLQDSATLLWANAMPNSYSYYDEKKKKYVEKEEPREPQNKFLRQSSPLNPVTFRFPMRIDSVLTIRREPDSTGKVSQIVRYEKRVSDNYEFMNLQDSICSTDLATFWKNTIVVMNSGKVQKFKSCVISILYSDGLVFNTHINNPTLLKNKDLVQQLKNTSIIFAFCVSDIGFKADNKQDYNLFEGFAWKVINCH